MTKPFNYSLSSIHFDEHYHPADNTRLTTNFANLARGDNRQENLRKTLNMINNRFNALAHWDNPTADRYSVEVDIISADLDIEGNGESFPVIETLKTTIVDHQTNERIDGMIGNSFSSYVRDYDFSVVLPAHVDKDLGSLTPDDFGELHGKLFQHLLRSEAYQANFHKNPVICLSVSSSKIYQRTGNQHPVLGLEYRQDGLSANKGSLTDQYFHKMGLTVRYFMPVGSVAPLAFYFAGDLLSDYSDLELISAIATMETFQKIYRPEIYNANSTAGQVYKPSLEYQDYSLTQVVYDRKERSQMAVIQGKFTEEQFIKLNQEALNKWAASFVVDSDSVKKRAA